MSSDVGLDENSRMEITHKEFIAFAKHFYELLTTDKLNKWGE